jgi:hypothetical protein
MASEPGFIRSTRYPFDALFFHAPFVTRVYFARTAPWFARKQEAIDQASLAAIDSIKDTS